MLRWWAEQAATVVELLAIAIIVVVAVGGTVMYLARFARRGPEVSLYEAFRRRVARGLLLSLELLVAADMIRTVLDPPSPA